MIPRLVQSHIEAALDRIRKIILIFGPRQAGKTTLIQALQKRLELKHKRILYLNCDNEENRSRIDTTALIPLQRLLSQTDILMLDEAQRLTDPGLTIKIIYDSIPSVAVVATGSSSFQLRNKATDALTGRYLDFTLYPFSFEEIIATQLSTDNSVLRAKQSDHLLTDILIYGLYPEPFLQPQPTSNGLS